MSFTPFGALLLLYCLFFNCCFNFLFEIKSFIHPALLVCQCVRNINQMKKHMNQHPQWLILLPKIFYSGEVKIRQFFIEIQQNRGRNKYN